MEAEAEVVDVLEEVGTEGEDDTFADMGEDAVTEMPDEHAPDEGGGEVFAAEARRGGRKRAWWEVIFCARRTSSMRYLGTRFWKVMAKPWEGD